MARARPGCAKKINMTWYHPESDARFGGREYICVLCCWRVNSSAPNIVFSFFNQWMRRPSEWELTLWKKYANGEWMAAEHVASASPNVGGSTVFLHDQI